MPIKSFGKPMSMSLSVSISAHRVQPDSLQKNLMLAALGKEDGKWGMGGGVDDCLRTHCIRCKRLHLKPESYSVELFSSSKTCWLQKKRKVVYTELCKLEMLCYILLESSSLHSSGNVAQCMFKNQSFYYVLKQDDKKKKQDVFGNPGTNLLWNHTFTIHLFSFLFIVLMEEPMVKAFPYKGPVFFADCSFDWIFF